MMSRHSTIRRLVLLVMLALVAGTVPAADGCDRLLVSGYRSSVHVYDACTGAFERQLAPRAQLTGAQAVREHEGLIYVVAEERRAVVRFRADTLAHVDDFILLPVRVGATGIDFGPDGDVYIGGYYSGSVHRFDGRTGADKGTVAGGIAGPDNGLTFGPDGRLYIPAFDSSSVERWDPASGVRDTFIPSGLGGLSRTRGILFEASGSVLVTSEGSDRVLRYRADGSFAGVVSTAVARPTGIAFDHDGALLVASYATNTVTRIDAASGTVLGTPVTANAGGLFGATFVARVADAAPAQVDAAQVGSQYWISGAGTPQGRTLDVEMQSSGGTVFGAQFDPGAIVNRRWGTLRLVFTGCDEAELTWSSSGAGSANFGQGGYRLQRLAQTEAGARCNAQGFAAAAGHGWMAGTWFGGPARSGEGLAIDVLENGAVLVAFFTHRPPLDAR